MSRIRALRTVPEAGWAGTKNGALLRAASGQFDVFITIDRNLAYQQDLDALSSAAIILVARTNRLSDLRPLVPDICIALDSAVSGRIIRVGG
jgi:hypothetical protein